jgi:type I restriction enzyme S subunit
MKDSGVAWLGAVPQHWQVLPNRAIFAEVNDRDHPEADMLSVTIKKGVIRQKALLEDSSKKDSSNLDKSAYKLVRPGDIAYNKMRAWQGAVGASECEGIVSPAYVVQRPRGDGAPRYLHYLLRTPAFAKEAERWSYGITSDMWSLRPEHFKLIYSCVPPLQEQAAIVHFLDYEDRRIRRYIRAKQKLIKLLEEQKQAVIHRAVTRGLDPNVRLKASGVEWLGDVPEHWKVKPLKFVVPQVTVGIVIQPARLYVASGIPCLRSLNISSGVIRGRELVFIAPETNSAHRKSQIFAGDIVVVRTGQAGVAAIVTSEFDGANCIDLLIVRASSQINSHYLLAYLNSWAARADVKYRSVGAIQAHYNTSTLANLIVPVPPLEDQQTILAAIAGEIAPLEAASATARSEIALLMEYRTRLIADVVTGKLDVRDAAARLSDEIEEPGLLEGIKAESDAEEEEITGPDGVPEEAKA